MTPHEKAEIDRKIMREAIGEMRAAVRKLAKIAERMKSNEVVLIQMQRSTEQHIGTKAVGRLH